MNSEKIHFFEQSLLFVVQSENGKTASFRLDTSKLVRLLASCLFVFFLLLLGTVFFFRERAVNQQLSKKLLVQQISVTPANAVATELKPKKINSKAKIQDFSGSCQLDTCSVNLILTAQENAPAEGSLLLLLETVSPQIGSGNPSAKSRQKYYAYPKQNIKEGLTLEEVFSLETKPYSISRSLTSSADFTVGKFQRPVAFHLYLFDSSHELVKHETIQVTVGDKNDP